MKTSDTTEKGKDHILDIKRIVYNSEAEHHYQECAHNAICSLGAERLHGAHLHLQTLTMACVEREARGSERSRYDSTVVVLDVHAAVETRYQDIT